MNVIRPIIGIGPDKCSKCSSPGFARDAGANGKKRKGQFLYVLDGWFFKLLLLRCSDCESIFCGACCCFETLNSDEDRPMVECLCPSCGKKLGTYQQPDKMYSKLVNDLRSRIDATDMNTVKAYFRDPNCEIKQIVISQNGCPPEEIAAVMVSGDQETLLNMLQDEWAKIGVDNFEGVKEGFKENVVSLDSYSDHQQCEVIYVPPAYIVKIISKN